MDSPATARWVWGVAKGNHQCPRRRRCGGTSRAAVLLRRTGGSTNHPAPKNRPLEGFPSLVPGIHTQTCGARGVQESGLDVNPPMVSLEEEFVEFKKNLLRKAHPVQNTRSKIHSLGVNRTNVGVHSGEDFSDEEKSILRAKDRDHSWRKLSHPAFVDPEVGMPHRRRFELASSASPSGEALSKKKPVPAHSMPKPTGKKGQIMVVFRQKRGGPTSGKKKSGILRQSPVHPKCQKRLFRPFNF